MSSIFGKSKAEYVPVQMPSDEDPAVRAAAEAEVKRMKKRRGYLSTILTGPGGLTAEATTTKQKLGE